jgi:protein-L-isoaspartate(D-aspartate) O-methyltransferase
MTVDRSFFVPNKFLAEAYMDYPLPIGDGQTIAQPSTVAIMLELLQPQEGDFVLEIGAGSGWITTLISRLVGSEGYIYSHEINRVVGEFGKSNLSRFLLKNYSFQINDASKHWQEKAPYNRIISGTALGEDEIEELIDLLVPNGIMIALTPDKDIRRISKDAMGNVSERNYSGFVFVPLP